MLGVLLGGPAWWRVVRLVVAALLLAMVVLEGSARSARLALSAMPGFDVVGEIEALRAEGRLAEAEDLARAGAARAAARGEDARGLERIAVEVAAERASWVRRAKDLGWGALTGRGETLEGLIGAVGSDMIVLGDVRDLVIEGGRLAIEGDADEVLVGLSAFGVVTTLTPTADWGVSLLKAVRKAGGLSADLGRTLAGWARAGDSAAIGKVAEDAGALARATSPAAAVRVLRGAESAEDVARVARLAESGADGAWVVRVAGRDAARVARLGGGTPEGVSALARGADRGPAGLAFVTGAGRAMLRPHVVVGLLKGVWKGTLPSLVQRWLERLDGSAWWVMGVLAAWVVWEGLWLVWGRRRDGRAGVERGRYRREHEHAASRD